MYRLAAAVAGLFVVVTALSAGCAVAPSGGRSLMDAIGAVVPTVDGTRARTAPDQAPPSARSVDLPISPEPVAGEPLVRPGDSGQRVTQIQRRLRSLGYWMGPVDGEFGPLTRQAVYAVQKAAGITRDGVV